MSKKKQDAAVSVALGVLDKAIESGDVNKMLDCINTLMAMGVTPTPRQIAKVSAHIYKTQNVNLATEFGVEYGAFGAFTDKLAEVVVAKGSAEDNFDYCLYVPNADLVAHGKAIRKKRSKMWWVAFSKHWPMIAEQIMAQLKSKEDNSKEKEAALSR